LKLFAFQPFPFFAKFLFIFRTWYFRADESPLPANPIYDRIDELGATVRDRLGNNVTFYFEGGRYSCAHSEL